MFIRINLQESEMFIFLTNNRFNNFITTQTLKHVIIL